MSREQSYLSFIINTILYLPAFWKSFVHRKLIKWKKDLKLCEAYRDESISLIGTLWGTTTDCKRNECVMCWLEIKLRLFSGGK